MTTADPEGPDQTASADPVDETPPARSPRARTALLALAGIAVLLVGVGAGLLIAASFPDSDPATDRPAADSAAVGFAQDMIRHHEQGVEMATIELNNGTDPQVRSMAFDILTAQSNEIGQMQSWLTRWGYPVINPNSPMGWMDHSMSAGHGSGAGSAPGGGDHSSGDHDSGEHDSGDHDHGDHSDGAMSGMPSAPATPAAPEPASPVAGGETPPMPGMATTAEMDRFRTLRGRDADVYFLQLMLRHHEGGLHMMEYAANPAYVTQPYVRDLADAMLRTQNKEIGIITAMLAERGAQPLPMN